ncbi:MAG: NPCBM/NEW2 domain-containing protein, partial [Planctomycetaceae bacterium]|nr:NPCBM/NEW2 domain-containing protein [Planctomycetaceae bacterium]
MKRPLNYRSGFSATSLLIVFLLFQYVCVAELSAQSGGREEAEGKKEGVAPVRFAGAKMGEWVDLLEWAEGVDWRATGDAWNAYLAESPSGKSIRMRPGSAGQFQRFPLPAVITGDYDAEFEFIRKGKNEGVGVFFPVGRHMLHLILGRSDGTQSVISSVDKKNYDDSPLKKTHVALAGDVAHRFTIRVRHKHEMARIEVDLDGEANFLQWEGPLWRLANDERAHWAVNRIQHLWLTSYDNETLFQKARVRGLSGSIRHALYPDSTAVQVGVPSQILRLVDERPVQIRVGGGRLGVNQPPLWDNHDTGDYSAIWPMVSTTPVFCKEYYAAHAPSRLVCPIPDQAVSFSVNAYNNASRAVKYQIFVDGKLLTETGEAPCAKIRLNLPRGAKQMELVTDSAGSTYCDRVYWCEPRFYSRPVDQIRDDSDRQGEAALPFTITESKLEIGGLTHNVPFESVGSGPLTPESLVFCHEFLFAHAPSSLVYELPAGATRFEAVGYCPFSQGVKYIVLADGKPVYMGERTCVEKISVALPAGTKRLELLVDDLGNSLFDRSMWCYPRVHYPEGVKLPAPSTIEFPSPSSITRRKRINFKGHQYMFVEGNWTIDEARRVGAHLGGQLARIESEEENQFLLSLLRDHVDVCWIDAGYDPALRKWTWSDGKPVADSRFLKSLAASAAEQQSGFSRTIQNWSGLDRSKRGGILCEWNSTEAKGLTYDPAGDAPEWTVLLGSSVNQMEMDPKG